jgi:hypothetical protein
MAIPNRPSGENTFPTCFTTERSKCRAWVLLGPGPPIWQARNGSERGHETGSFVVRRTRRHARGGDIWFHEGADADIGFHGTLALILGAGASLVIGGGLMVLIFFSSRRGYDDEVGR